MLVSIGVLVSLGAFLAASVVGLFRLSPANHLGLQIARMRIVALAWGLVALNRLNWVMRFGNLTRFMRGLEGSPWTVCLSLSMLALGAAGLILCLSNRLSIVGPVALLLSAVHYLVWQLLAAHLSVLAVVPTRGLKALLYFEIELVILSLITVPTAAIGAYNGFQRRTSDF